MKRLNKCLLLLALLIPAFTTTSCGKRNTSSTEGSSQTSQKEFVDIAAGLKFNKDSGRAYCEATLKMTIDGDTTHFYVDSSVVNDGVLKARYLGVDTPESTGKVEEYGKQASKFTKEKLTKDPNVKIILESNTSTWNPDSTGDRYLVFVWYKTSDMADYKCLNVEIMQNGLAKAKNGNATVYGKELQAALTQAMDLKLKIYSGEKDPEYYYGDYIETTIRGLKETPEEYKGKVVRFEGTIARIASNTAYVVDYDEDSGITYGMTVFYGYDAAVCGEMEVGRLISWCGTYQLYETTNTYQVSGLTYMAMKPTYSKNLRVLQEGIKVEPIEITGAQFNMTTPEERYGGISYLDCILSSYVSMKDLTVTKVYTTKKGSSTGAMTITCTAKDGQTIQLRTIVLKKADGTLLCEDDVMGKTLDAVGIIGKYENDDAVSYQIMVLALNDLTIK